MIAILTDKPSVGKEIGRIIGATRVRNGYVEGNGYMVTWTFGNMLSLAMPKDYGTQKLERNDFPFIPSEFELMVRHTRTENGWIPDIDAVLQLKVIERVFQACDTIIAATDASRDGEMTFRYVYQYLNCTQPCFRLWISSLTDESVRKAEKVDAPAEGEEKDAAPKRERRRVRKAAPVEKVEVAAPAKEAEEAAE